MGGALSTQHEATEAGSSRAAPPVSKPAPHRVLLVEDHGALAEATAAFLRLSGLEVRIASSGVDALKMAEEFHPVHVLCDMSLPDMTGLDVARALRAQRGGNDLLVAMLTAMNVADLHELERETDIHGVNLYLSKPLTSNALSRLLSSLEVLRRAVRRDPASSP